MWKDQKRAARRAQARRVILARIRDWRSTQACSYDFGEDPRRIAQSGRLRKGSAFGCNCRKRARGAPHRGGGICHQNAPAPFVLERRDGRRQCREWLRVDDMADADPIAGRPWIERTW